MSANPLITIVLPTFNCRRFLARSIETCLMQAHGNVELIVVDGGSTDGTLDIVAGFDDPRVRLLHQASNAGRLPGALNEGFAAARGDFWTWAQADDYYWPEALQVLFDHLARHPEFGLAYTGYWIVDEYDQVLGAATLGPPEQLWWTNPVGHCFLYRREVGETIGPYSLDHLFAEDFQYWLRVYRRFGMAYLPEPYYAHRLHPDSLTVANYGRYESLRVAARARRAVLGLGWHRYQQQLAAAWIEEAFAAHANGESARVRACLALGLPRDPRWLRNRGVRSILAQALLGRSTIRRLRWRPSASHGASGKP